jgi:formate hydrogenlyase subunit 3/multisubunit Na+/H+ antiporter MnhD subunit
MVFIAFSVAGPLGVVAGLAVALHHLVVKPALFSLAANWKGSLDGLAGAARRAPIAAGLFVLFALSLIGVPPLPGFWTKLLVLTGLAQEGSGLHWVAFGAILVVTVIEANYLFRVAARLYGKSDEAPSAPPLRDFVPTAVLGAVLVLSTLLVAPVSERLREVARQASDVAGYTATVFPESTLRRDRP